MVIGKKEIKTTIKELESLKPLLKEIIIMGKGGNFVLAAEDTGNMEKSMNTAIAAMTSFLSSLPEPEENRQITKMMAEAHKTAIEHGWWEGRKDFGTLIALCHCELSEAMEEYRKGLDFTEVYMERGTGEPKGIPYELADVVIRIFDLCEYYEIDLEEAVKEKMLYNRERPYRHGGKRL